MHSRSSARPDGSLLLFARRPVGIGLGDMCGNAIPGGWSRLQGVWGTGGTGCTVYGVPARLGAGCMGHRRDWVQGVCGTGGTGSRVYGVPVGLGAGCMGYRRDWLQGVWGTGGTGCRVPAGAGC